MLPQLLKRRRTYVDYLDRVLIRLPDTAAVRSHGLAGAVREVVIGRLHVRIPHRTGHLVRIPHREAGIDRDPLTSWLFIRPECLAAPPSQRRAPTRDTLTAGSVTGALAGSPRHASIVIAIDDCPHQAHAVADVSASGPSHITIGRDMAFSASAGAVSPTMATIRVRDLRDALGLADPAEAVLLHCSDTLAYTVRSVTVASSRVVWLVAGQRITTARPLLARLIRWATQH